MTDDDELADLRVRTEVGDRLDAVDESRGDEVGESDSETNADDDSESVTRAEEPEEGSFDTQHGSPKEDSDSDASPMEEELSGYDAEERETLVTAIDAKIDELEGPQYGIHIWNKHLAATIAVIESDPALKEEIVESLESRCGTEVEVESQSKLLGRILRIGLEEVEPSVIEALREATKQRALRDM